MSTTLPPDPQEMNELRSDWADAALKAFTSGVNTDPEDMLADLLCDLHHWADRNGEDFDSTLARANMHYEAETTA